jgi:hypothetical protein
MYEKRAIFFLAMRCTLLRLLPLLALSVLCIPVFAQPPQHFFVDEPWRSLRKQVEDRLYVGIPFARPCFPGYSGDSAACRDLQADYRNEGNATID